MELRCYVCGSKAMTGGEELVEEVETFLREPPQKTDN
jgi:hypothetical protein